MDRHLLILSEYHVQISEDTPIYQFQQFSDAAQARRDDRIKAAQEGKQYVG
jgi:hypothetical protein